MLFGQPRRGPTSRKARRRIALNTTRFLRRADAISPPRRIALTTTRFLRRATLFRRQSARAPTPAPAGEMQVTRPEPPTERDKAKRLLGVVESMSSMQQRLADATRRYQLAVEDLGASQGAVANAAMKLAMAQQEAFKASKAVLGAADDGLPPDDYINVAAEDIPSLGLSGYVPLVDASMDETSAVVADDLLEDEGAAEYGSSPDVGHEGEDNTAAEASEKPAVEVKQLEDPAVAVDAPGEEEDSEPSAEGNVVEVEEVEAEDNQDLMSAKGEEGGAAAEEVPEEPTSVEVEEPKHAAVDAAVETGESSGLVEEAFDVPPHAAEDAEGDSGDAHSDGDVIGAVPDAEVRLHMHREINTTFPDLSHALAVLW